LTANEYSLEIIIDHDSSKPTWRTEEAFAGDLRLTGVSTVSLLATSPKVVLQLSRQLTLMPLHYFQIQAGDSREAVGEVYIFKTGKADRSCDTDWDLT
jgi:hypothetical protein